MNPCRLTVTTPLETQSQPQNVGLAFFGVKLACVIILNINKI